MASTIKASVCFLLFEVFGGFVFWVYATFSLEYHSPVARRIQRFFLGLGFWSQGLEEALQILVGLSGFGQGV